VGGSIPRRGRKTTHRSRIRGQARQVTKQTCESRHAAAFKGRRAQQVGKPAPARAVREGNLSDSLVVGILVIVWWRQDVYDLF
jgi:hypothetical protein